MTYIKDLMKLIRYEDKVPNKRYIHEDLDSATTLNN